MGAAARASARNRRIWFEAPGRVVVRDEPVAKPGRDEVRIRSRYSALSAGTELLLYRGQFPEGVAIDETIGSYDRRFAYPTPYGYALVGPIEAVGEGVDAGLVGRRVFAYAAHQSRPCVHLEAIVEIPDDLDDLDAVFLASAETAVTIVLDSKPLLQERVIVFGQGVVGLLVTGILSRFPLDGLDVVENQGPRRECAAELGGRVVPGDSRSGAYDLAIEVSGAPELLDHAIQCVRYAGRVVVGSWYGKKTVPLSLGEHFHRGRIQVISSQVSTLAPELRGGWTRRRRHEAAWRCIRDVRPARWVTHTFDVDHVAEAFALLDQSTEHALQVCFSYLPEQPTGAMIMNRV